ncbi:MAG TPA: hypothetical protein VLF89_01000 [Candidatus Saccharimonadales bacterium]|nr:hypothetical protein [Candidatus Saccharimonadales bacterium]
MVDKNRGSAKMIIVGCVVVFITILIAFIIINNKNNFSSLPSNNSSGPNAIVTTYQTNNEGKSNGNNRIATDYAQQLTVATEKIKPGLVSHVNLHLEPLIVNTTNPTEYKNSVTLARLTVQVNKNIWDSLRDNERKDLINTYMNTLRFSPNTPEAFIITDTKGATIATGHQ